MKNAKYILMVLTVSLLGVGCAGKKGDTGPAGGGRVIATMNCQGIVSGMTGGAAPLNGIDIEYNAVLTAGGDVYATANVIDESSQASATKFYAAAEAGSSTASVLVTNDYIGSLNGGFWEVSLNRNSLVTSVVYDDPSLPAAVNMTFTASSCSVANY